ncbi:MAG: BatA domain-containing protein [Planctomycetales bacterium]|nr:BatA domain-containing protein [Planctomycetales bacterium]
MQFVYQALTWGFLLALLPLLIHLINMMRHKRVKWAAMEFLLQSYKKHRRWIWLKQLLLLLARMAAVALVVAMLAQLKTRDQLLALFGGKATHHYVLLDDSYSMSDRVAGQSAFDASRQVISSIVAGAKSADNPQKLTLLRYSQARGGGDISANSAADFNSEIIDSEFDLTLEKKQRTWEPTDLALGPRDSLSMLRELLAQAKDETPIVYVLSDFRAKDWGTPAELRTALEEVKKNKADIHLVNCSRSREPNLGIVEILPADDTRAAGVPLFVNVKVKNFGATEASKVQLKLSSMFYPPDDLTKTPPESRAGVKEDLATLLLEKIGPGETLTRRVQVYFPQPGKHVVQAALPEDPVEADNHRWCVIEFPDGEKTLLIDGSIEQKHSYHLEVAFRPLEKSNTGIRPEIKPPSFLRDIAADALKQYATIYLLDVPSLEDRTVLSLEEYVRGGGGLAIFAGPDMNITFYNNRFYKEGKGLFPLPLLAPMDLPPPLDANEPDIELVRHPIFSFFLDQTNPLIRGVKVDKYLAAKKDWKPEPNSGTSVIASLRNKSPFIVEKKFGEGTVVACLTTVSPEWNDWAKNPSLVVLALKMQAYLATARRLDDPRLVGTPLDVTFESSKYRPELSFTLPKANGDERQKIDRQATQPEAGKTAFAASLGRGQSRDTDHAGIYEAWPRTTKGEITESDIRRWAFNVEPEEGDLATVESKELLTKLDPVRVTWNQAESYEQQDLSSSGYNLSQMLMIGLICLLIGEQLLAYSTSYHPLPGAAR